MNDDLLADGFSHLIFHCGQFSENERVLILFDEYNEALASKLDVFLKSKKINCQLFLLESKCERIYHLPEVEYVNNFNLSLALTVYSIAHTSLRKSFCNNGGRFLSLPSLPEESFYSKDFLHCYTEEIPQMKNLQAILDVGENIVISSFDKINSAQYQLQLSISRRFSNFCPGIALDAGGLASPPDSEVNIAPIEDTINGRIVVTGSIATPEIGLIPGEAPLILEFQKGRLVKCACSTANVSNFINERILGSFPCRSVVGELGFGFNPKSQLRGIMLHDEGVQGAIHLGFGSNQFIGGKNSCDFHLDMVTKDCSVLIDGNKILHENRYLV